VVLVFQTAGVLVAAAAVVLLGDLRLRRSMAVGVVVVVTVASALNFWRGGWQKGQKLLDARAANSKLSTADAATAGGRAFHAREDFLRWVETRLPEQARVYLVCTSACTRGLDYWITFRLLPRRFANRAAQADWVLFYATRLRSSGVSRTSIGRFVDFAPGYGIARVRR
jgi:hypothetical protein